jgi:pimeloyl-ACP methyl ester carboxylesterase
MAMWQPAGPSFAPHTRSRLTQLLVLALLGTGAAARAEHRLLSVGGHRLSIDCDGDRTQPETVVLIAGLGQTVQAWAKVQPAVSKFARVCSYDRAGSGESEKVGHPQSLDEIVEDLHSLLNAAGEKAPYVLVGHSIAGIYCRRFATKFPRDVSGFLFLNSFHEEQTWRLHELFPNSPPPNADLADLFFVKTGQRLDWHTNAPLIVITQGDSWPLMHGLTDEQNAAFGRLWRELQEDLARRSPSGQFRVAERSGPVIQIDQPGFVVEAIRDLVRLANR